MDTKEVPALRDQVRCPACKGNGCLMCSWNGHVYKTTAELWLDIARMEGWLEEEEGNV